MKLLNTTALVSSFVAADNKNIASRTPDQRLITLGQAYRGYVKNLIKPFRSDRAAMQERRIMTMVEFGLRTYFNRECVFFDPNVPHGGPRRDNSVNRERKRRDVDTEDPFDIYEEKYQDGVQPESVQLSPDSVIALRQVFSRIDEVFR